MPIKFPEFSFLTDLTSQKLFAQKTARHDIGVGVAFVGAIAVLMLVAGYVINRLSREQAHQKKWQDYSDCGWA